ncbi:chromosome partitioning protein [Actinoplanes sp. NBRC 101535]|uniref:chromosome partitioning protein n=1 Tax=Actinoplanes sp. NBRC 101535 TaxID=3032196 RepID=UPI003338DA57
MQDESVPPPRDVEPFWDGTGEPSQSSVPPAPSSPGVSEAPVHGRVVPLDGRRPPAVEVEPGVYRPAGRAAPELPPGVHVPAQRAGGSRPPARDPGPDRAAPGRAIPDRSASGHPASDHAASDHTVSDYANPDSPWAQPLHRPADPLAAPVPPPTPESVPLPTPEPVPALPPPPTALAPWTRTVPPASTERPPGFTEKTGTPEQPGALEKHGVPAMPDGPNPFDEPPAGNPFQELAWLADGTPTAEEFARRRMARPPQQDATMGPRALLRKSTLGLVKMAPGRREREFRQDVEMVRRNFGGLRQVTVVNPKGGAGKTVAVVLLAMTFGQKRGGYVLAWDNNETQGTLGMRAQQDFHARTVRDMLRDLHLFQGSQGRVGDLSQYVRAQGEGMFDVLASDESATAGEMLTAGAFAEIRDVVSRFYKLIFVDTGNNVRAENWQAAMDATDQLVITMSARNDSAETAARMLDHLEQSGRRRLVRQAVTVVTMPPTRKDIDLPAIEKHFAARTRAVLLAPYEKLVDSGEPIRYGELSADTRDAWLKIAAAVAEGL